MTTLEQTEARPSLATRGLAALGSPLVAAARAGRALAALFAHTLSASLRGRREPGEVLRQMYQAGNRSLLFVTVTVGFIAMVSIYQVCLQLNQVTGDLSKVGAEFIKLLSHETAPTITAMMLCTRVGAGIAAEVGSMMVTEQVDALRMSGVDPVSYLVVPRFLACLVVVPALILYATVVALASATAMAYLHFGVNPTVFLDPSAVRYSDLATGLAKAFAYGAAIPVISGYCGLSTHEGRGSEGVGSATTRAVIGSSLAVIVLDFILGTIAFLLFQSGGKG
jgi:phospholipid/cholesterol/gamma-HCH transport system permease protein